MNKITLSFQDLNINLADYMLQNWSMTRAEIINRACDLIMHFVFEDEAEEDCLFDVANAHVNMAAKTVTIKTSAYPTH